MDVINPWVIFQNTLSAMAQIALIGAIGYWAYARGMIRESSLMVMSKLVIEISFPCYIFSHIVKNLAIENLAHLFWLPLASTALLGLAFVIATLYTKKDSNIVKKGEFIALATFQNAVYIPIPIIASLFHGIAQNQMFMYLFIFNIPFSALLFTVGTHVFRHSNGYPFSWRTLFSNPVMAVLFGIFCVYTGIHKYIPHTIESSMDMVGKITVPLVMIVIGSTIYLNYKSEIKACIKTIAKVVILKLLIIPFTVLGILCFFPLSDDLSFLLILEASMPAASTLSLIARRENADYKLVGTVILWSYIFALITVPFFLSLYYYVRY